LSAEEATPELPQVLAVPGLFNLRDLGGYETPDGTLRRRLLFRSDALARLTDEARAAVSELGLRTAIDMREVREGEAMPATLEGMGIELFGLPLMETPISEEHYELLGYNEWLLRDRSAAIARVVEPLCRPDALPAVIFCRSGKDRTGLMSALILSALGVGDDDVSADYAVTESLIPKEHILEVIQDEGYEQLTEAQKESSFGAPAEMMQMTLEGLSERYGGAWRYLVDAGVSEDALEGFKAQMIEPR
jgi:protein-tyrosine phosphatase